MFDDLNSRYFLILYTTIAERFQLDAIPCFKLHHYLASTYCKKFAISFNIAASLQETAVIFNVHCRRLLIPKTLCEVPFTSSFNSFPLPQGCQNW